MNLPKVIEELIKAQNSYDSEIYAKLFSVNAVVIDEGKTYNGRAEIKDWINNANEKYRTIMRPLAYEEKEKLLSCEISGNFTGSPITLNYHFKLKGDIIENLEIK